jgi:signal transduction histidine kinase
VISSPLSLTAPRRSRILVVDDITRNLQVVGMMLRQADYEVMPATGGLEALEGVRVQPPDLILLDLMMPEMDGLEVCRQLKSDPALQAIPVIFLTASNEMEHLVKGFEVGAVDYITKPFNAPELLARVRTHLELQHARERLREMNEEKNEFMGIAAHDLRNPLSAIQGYAEMIREDAQSLADGNVKDLAACASDVESNSRKIGDLAARMAGMVQNLLDANRIERGEMKLNLVTADLAPILSSVVETQRPRAGAKQQVLHVEAEAEPTKVRVDTTVAAQVLENLISNAVKYSPPGKNIFITCKRMPQAVRCEVRDEGPGLSASDQKKLFGKFVRLSAKPTGGEHATGLGLSIVKRMVEGMNGKVWCESEVGSGATFVVELPIA